MENKYKVLVFDLDGTLTNSEKKITPKTKDAILRASEKGLKIVLASGRPTEGVYYIAKELGLFGKDAYILSYNGGKIISTLDEKVIVSKDIDSKYFEQIKKEMEKYSLDIMSYIDGEVVTNNALNEFVGVESFITKIPVKELNDFWAEVKPCLPKFIFVYDNKHKKANRKDSIYKKEYDTMKETDYLGFVESFIKEKFEGELEVYRSEPFFLEILPKDIDKAKSLYKLCEILNISSKEMMAFGDGYNDISMVKFAGMGVAMGNAVDEVKKVANYITDDNNSDGIEKALVHLGII